MLGFVLAASIVASPSPAPHPSPTIRTRPASTEAPRHRKALAGHNLTGTATWYAYRRGEAAAGPALRRALPGWRGRTVLVNGVRVRLTDYMGTTNQAKVIDLDAGLFRAICGPLSRGVCRVTVSW
jgi:hypothetical protein